MQELSDLWRDTAPDAVNIFRDFSPREFAIALHHLKPAKVPSPDSYLFRAFNPCWSQLKVLATWLPSCLCQLKILKVWRRALVVAIPKPSKSVEHPQSYHSISLFCVPYKILEQLIYIRVEPIVNPSQRSGLDFDTESLP